MKEGRKEGGREAEKGGGRKGGGKKEGEEREGGEGREGGKVFISYVPREGRRPAARGRRAWRQGAPSGQHHEKAGTQEGLSFYTLQSSS